MVIMRCQVLLSERCDPMRLRSATADLSCGIFQELGKTTLRDYDDSVGIEWKWQTLDGAITKSQLGWGKTGKSPTGRGKCGVKRSVLVDENGVQLGVSTDGANVDVQ